MKEDYIKLLIRIRKDGINEARTHGLRGVTGVPDWCLTQAVMFRAANMVVWGFEDGKELKFEEVMKEAIDGIVRKPEVLKLLCHEISALVDNALREAGEEGRSPIFVDVGCGSGLALALITNHPAIKGRVEPHLIGVDHDPHMIEALKIMLPQVTSLQASAESLPIRSGVADAVLSIGMVHEVSSVKNFMKSVSRVLRKGGEVLVADSFAPSLTAAIMKVGRRIRAAMSKGPENPWGLNEVLDVLRSSGLRTRYVRKLGSSTLRTYPAIIVAVKELEGG